MRRPVRDPVLRATLALFVAGCAPAIQQAYVAPTSETVISQTDEGPGDAPSHTIYVLNRSTVPVTVFGVALRGCQNIKQQCEARTVAIHVAPGRRVIAMRVEPKTKDRAFSYNFGFSWHADSSGAAAAARTLAAAGDSSARRRLSEAQRADSLSRLDVGYRELTPDAFAALRDRAASMRAEPESLVIAPGEQTTLERVRLLIVDKEQRILGRTRWVGWRWSVQRTVQFQPPDRIVGLRPGRTSLRFSLAEDAQSLLSNTIADVEVPIVVAYAFDAHAPVFAGVTTDANTKKPLMCARVALEDSAQNIVSRGRSDAAGTFILRAPRPGTFRMRVDVDGWAPALGQALLAGPDETKQAEYPVSFTEQQLLWRAGLDELDRERARPVAVSTPPIPSRPGTTTLIQGVTLGGSETMPILGIISRVALATLWAQFAVNDTGRVDTTSVVLSVGTAANARAAVMRVLPQIRFSPARQDGKAICELVRLQVNFTPR